MSDSLFDQVVKALGLSPLIAPFVVRRICATSGFIAATMDRKQLQSILGELSAAVRLYQTPEEAARAIERLRQLASLRAA